MRAEILMVEINIKQIARDARRQRIQLEAQQRKTQKIMARLMKDLGRLYPHEDFMQAIIILENPDLVWLGDFDNVRIPLAALMLKAHATGVFNDELVEVTEAILTERMV